MPKLVGMRVKEFCLWRSAFEKAAPLVLHKTQVAAHIETVQRASTGSDAGLQRKPRFTCDHIDDAADGVRTVNGRGRSLDDLDPLEAAYRLAVHV